jgi:hypothetical protein
VKELDLSQLFCEVLGGLAAILLLVGLLDLLGAIDLQAFLGSHADRLSLTALTGILILSYLAGIVVDAIGMAFDGLPVVEKHLMSVNSAGETEEVRKKNERSFVKSAPEHLFQYRKEQWAYYSCYRNLFILMPLGTTVWAWLAFKYELWQVALVVVAIGVLLTVVLWNTMKEMLDIYRTKLPSDYAS